MFDPTYIPSVFVCDCGEPFYKEGAMEDHRDQCDGTPYEYDEE